MDIAPTILDVCGIKDVARFDGKVLSDGARRPTLTFLQNLVFEHIDTDRYRIFRFPTELDTRLYFEGPPSEYASVDFGRNSIEYPSGFLERIDYSNFSTNVEEFTVPPVERMKYFAYQVGLQEANFGFTVPGTAIAKLKRKVRRTRFRITVIGIDSPPPPMRLSVTATDESGESRIVLDQEVRETVGVSVSRWGKFVRVDQGTPLVVESPVHYQRLAFKVDSSVTGKWLVLINGVPERRAISATTLKATPIDERDDALIRQLEALGYLDR